jgi:hypothetical protein
MKSKLKPLKVTAKADGGVHDVSVNHDRYLAEFTYARKLRPNASFLHRPQDFGRSQLGQPRRAARAPQHAQTAAQRAAR